MNASALEQEISDILTGRRGSDWAGFIVKKRAWSFLADIHPALADLGPTLAVGLPEVLRRHESTLLQPIGYMAKDEFDQIVHDLGQMHDRLKWMAELVGVSALRTLPRISELSDDEEKSKSATRDLIAHLRKTDSMNRLLHLGNPKRGSSRSAFLDNPKSGTKKDLISTQARFRVFLMLQLAQEVFNERKKRGISKGSHPFQHVLKLGLNLDRWAKRALSARDRLKSSKRVASSARAAVIADLWKLWKRQLITCGKTQKGRPIIQSRNSPLFLALVDHTLSSFTQWRKKPSRRNNYANIVVT